MQRSRSPAAPAGTNDNKRKLRKAIAAGLVLGGGIILAGSAFPQSESSATAGVLANACTSCHGVNGHSETAIPSIGGLAADYIVQAMTGFRDGTRPSTIMGRIAGAYTDDEIAAIAAYYAER